jgi:4-hydroxyphenylpyruvate dioxygenase
MAPLETNPSESTKIANPMGTDGFEFVEFAAPEPDLLKNLFQHLGFTAIARHRTKSVTLYRQGGINFLLNEEPNSFAADFASQHGPCACAMAFRVKDAAFAYQRALTLDAKGYEAAAAPGTFAIPVIYGIGDSLLYLVDRYNESTIYDDVFDYFPGVDQHPQGAGLDIIDHLTHNVYQGRMDHWAAFYERLFDFYEQRYFNIIGAKSGLLSRALASPCGKIRIPINESQDTKSQIAEYLKDYRGEGIQHIALSTRNIISSVKGLSAAGVPFMSVPESYYDVVNERLPRHGLDLVPLRELEILIDGEISETEKNLLLQIFTNTVIGPIFFEIIQRMGHEGFGEGNFSALFEAIERDQMRRGVL